MSYPIVSVASMVSTATDSSHYSVQEEASARTPDPEQNVGASAKEAAPISKDDDDNENENDDDKSCSTAQAGVSRVLMMRKMWSTKMIVVAYMMIWLILFTDSLQQGMSTNLVPYVTSAFNSHSLTAATTVMSSIIGGLVKLPLAKVLDIWGRPQGFALSLLTLVIGLVIMAACHNVNTYAAAQVFYWVGFNGLAYTLQIFLADTSALENRALIFAFSTSPFLITAWAVGPLSTVIRDGLGFRWGYGMFAALTPVVCAPLLILFSYQGTKTNKAIAEAAATAAAAAAAAAKAAGTTAAPPKDEEEKPRTTMQLLKHYAKELDVIGLLLIISGLALFLLPFSIYSYQARQWQSPMILGFLFAGIGFVIAFGVYEKYAAPKTFIPFSLMMDRTVVGCCIATGGLFVSFSIWQSFYASFLQVVTGISMAQAGYIISIFSIGSCFFAFIAGFLIRWTGRFKWIAVYFGVPATAVGVALLAIFRFPSSPLAVIIVAQVLIAFAGGAMVICDQMALMAVVPHEYVAVGLALENMFANIGGGIGSTVSSALWTGIFPKALARHLPDMTPVEIHAIYEDLSLQLAHPKGTAIRDGIELAYGDAQKYMSIAAAAVLTVPMVSVLIWRNVKINDVKDVRNAQRAAANMGQSSSSGGGADNNAGEAEAAGETTTSKWWQFKGKARA